MFARSSGDVRVGKCVFQVHAINHRKDTFQQGLGHLKSDEIMILLRGITALRHLSGFGILGAGSAGGRAWGVLSDLWEGEGGFSPIFVRYILTVC
jgi:hypothetical protein